MAFNRAYVLFLVAAAMFFTMMSSATEFIVGDDSGWTIGFDYAVWAKDKHFQVGDKLIFQYPVGAHSVFKVNGTSFQNCVKPPANEALVTGNDSIVLATPGRKWYICGVGQHCDLGQKLVINVLPLALSPDMPPSPSPLPGMPQTWKMSRRSFFMAPSPSPSPLPGMTHTSKVPRRPFLMNHHWW